MESKTTIRYLPVLGMNVNEIMLSWGMERFRVRESINGRYEEKNAVIDMGIYDGGANAFEIHQRRDVFQEINGSECLIFFNYDKEDLLREVEVHGGAEFFIEDTIIDFDKDFLIISDELSGLYGNPKEIDHETLLFEKVNLVVASNEALGGEGNNLGYLYMTNDISHLIK